MDTHQNHKGYYNFHRRDKKFLRAVMGKLRDLKQIVSDASHNLTYFCIIVVGIGQFHQMGIGIPAHIRLYPGTHDVSGSCHVITAQAVDNTQQQIQHAHPHNDFQCKAAGIYQGNIGNVTENHGKHQFTDSRHTGTEQVKYQRSPIGFKIRKKT